MSFFGPGKGIRKKLLLSYLAITIPLIIVIIFTQYNRYEDKRRDIMVARLSLARNIASNFDHFIKEVSNTEKIAGTAIAENNYTRSRASSYLARAASKYPLFSMDYVKLNGEVYASSNPSLVGEKLHHENINIGDIAKQLDTKQEWIITPLHDHGDGGIGFDVVTGIWYKAKLYGVIVASVDSTRLNEVFVFEVPGGGYNITDNNGMLIYQNQYPKKPLDERYWGAHKFIKVASKGKEFTSYGLIFPIDDTYRMGAQVPIQSIGWSAGSFVPVEEVMAPIRADVIRSGAVTIVVMLLALFLGFWFAERIVRPIMILANKARDIAKGEFEEEIGLLQTGDEIEDLAESFNAMQVNLREYVSELSGLVEVGEKMNLALNIPFVENAVANALRSNFDAKAVWIALYDEHEKVLKIDYFWSDSGLDFNGLKISPGLGIAGRVLMSGKPAITHAASSSEFLYKDIALEVGVESAVTLPLVSGGGALGVIGIFTPLVKQQKIGEKEMSLLMALANQAAVAIENARLYEESRESERRLRASNDDLRILNSVALDISSGLDLTELLEKTAKNAAEIVGADFSSIALFDKENEKLDYMYKIRSPKSTPPIKVPRELGLSETVLKIHRTVFTNDYKHDPRAHKEALMQGVSAVAATPLLIGNRLIGVIQVGLLNGKTFADGDISLLESVGNQAAVAIENARLYKREKDVAEALQNALLAVPDKLSGIKLGLLYRSATDGSKVGGDFYDFIEFANGKIGVVIGDVSGKGLEAATATALVKMTIKAFAYECDTPAEVLARANRVILSQMVPGQFITIAYVVIDPATGRIVYASAGHPAPIIANYAISAMPTLRQLEMGSIPLGVEDNPSYKNHTEELTSKEIMLLYTDGLLEAKQGGMLFGEEGISEALLGAGDTEVEAIPGKLFDAAQEFASGKLNDDVAIIALGLDKKTAHKSADVEMDWVI